MARKLATIAADPYLQSNVLNHEGFPAFTRGAREQVLQALQTGNLEPTFYVDRREVSRAALASFEAMAQSDPGYLARAIVYARTEGFIRSAPILALAVLSKANPGLFRLIFPQVVRTPNDLLDFLAAVRGKVVGRGLGRAVKGAIGEWLASISEYHVVKYGSVGRGWSLRDALRLARPKPASERQSRLYRYLLGSSTEEDRLSFYRDFAQLAWFELLKSRAKDEPESLSEAEAIRFVTEGRLPYEAVVGVVQPTKGLWVELMRQMPYQALLKHLNALERASVFADEESVAYVAQRLTDATALRRARILPFQLLAAVKAFQGNLQVKFVLDAALNLSFAGMPALPGKVAIGVDVSGSMQNPVSARSTVRCSEVASLFAAALWKSAPDSEVLPFDLRVHEFLAREQCREEALYSVAARIANLGGGGTCLALPVEWLHANRVKADLLIEITDSEDWAGRGFLAAWREYKRVVPAARAVLVQLTPNRALAAPPAEPGVHYVHGWSDAVVRFVAQVAAGSSQVAAVEAVRLGSAPEPMTE